jgi:hypothetical protein
MRRAATLFQLSLAIPSKALLSGHLGGVGPGHELVDLAGRVAVDEAAEHVGGIGLGVVDDPPDLGVAEHATDNGGKLNLGHPNSFFKSSNPGCGCETASRSMYSDFKLLTEWVESTAGEKTGQQRGGRPSDGASKVNSSAPKNLRFQQALAERPPSETRLRRRASGGAGGIRTPGSSRSSPSARIRAWGISGERCGIAGNGRATGRCAT